MVRFFLVGFLLVVIPALSWAESRFALVVGNSAYETSHLKNPINDAVLMEKTLSATGFSVTLVTDTDLVALKKAISDFGQKLDKAGKDAVGLFYYAGHGVQAKGRNYLLPVDARIRSEADLDIYAMSAEGLLSTMEYARNRLNIIILDACRDNPYTRSFRSMASGLAQMRAPKGSLMAYSTAPGDVAYDGNGANSPYALALARQITSPGQSLVKLFQNVAAMMDESTGGKQTPWYQSSVIGDFHFMPPNQLQTTVIATAPATAVTADSVELEYWRSIRDSETTTDFTAYLKQFPNGTFADLARNRMENQFRRQAISLQTEIAALEKLEQGELTNPQIFWKQTDLQQIQQLVTNTQADDWPVFTVGREDWKKGWSRLHLAAWHGRRDAASLLIRKGAKLDASTPYGLTPLHLAARKGHSELASLLIARGANLHARQKAKWTALYYAINEGYLEIVSLLISTGANIHDRGPGENTPLHLAAWKDRKKIASLLVDMGAEVNARNDYDLTPLHRAAIQGHKGMVQLLIDTGAEINTRSMLGTMPIDDAKRRGNIGLVELLQR